VNFADLLQSWAQASEPPRTATAYSVRLPVEDAARLAALADLYPGRSRDDMITDLLGVALNGVTAALPYRPGPTVISTDDHGDPVYEDIGPTPRFMALAREHLHRLNAELARQAG
jgi:hypothetical protein